MVPYSLQLVQRCTQLKPPRQVWIGQEEPSVRDKVSIAFRHHLVAFLPVVPAGGDERAVERLPERQEPVRDVLD